MLQGKDLKAFYEERKRKHDAIRTGQSNQPEREKEENPQDDRRFALKLAQEEAEKANQEDATYVVNFLTSAFDREIARTIVKDELRQETDEAIAHSLQSEMLAADLQQEEDEAFAKALANRPGRK